jgi:uncharacterized protein YebE (UPF0316 family)
VILNTLTSIFKIKSGKIVASLSSAICYAFYVYVLIYTMADFPDYIKAILTAVTNFVGVFISMWVLEKIKKDKLWQITATLKGNPMSLAFTFEKVLNDNHISYTCIPTNNPNEYVYNIYSKSQKESKIIRDLLNVHRSKYIIHAETEKL